MIARACFAFLLLTVGACTPPAQTSAPALTPEQQEQLTREDAEIAACGYVGCHGPFHAAPELDIGRIAMGASVRLPPGSHCDRGNFQNYGPGTVCGFTSDGITYVALDGKVVEKSVDVTTPRADMLPFGLQRRQTPEQAITTMRTHTHVPLRIDTFPRLAFPDTESARYVHNEHVLKNGNDYPFLFTLLFVNDGLVQILLQDPSAPSD